MDRDSYGAWRVILCTWTLGPLVVLRRAENEVKHYLALYSKIELQ